MGIGKPNHAFVYQKFQNALSRQRKHLRLALCSWIAAKCWRQSLGLARLEQFAPSESDFEPIAEMDFEHPWHAISIRGPVSLLSNESAASIAPLAGIARKGSPAPDWDAICTRAGELFKLAPANLGQELKFQIDKASADNGLAMIFQMEFSRMPFGRKKLSGIRKFINHHREYFDSRRAHWREGTDPPESWCNIFGPMAGDLWSLGLGAKSIGKLSRFDPLSEAQICLGKAMSEHGALACTRLCGFFANIENPAFALSNQNLLSKLLQERWEGHAIRQDLNGTIPAPAKGKKRLRI